MDPLAEKYAQLSSYNYSDNNPINDYDIDGMQNTNTESSEQGDDKSKIVIQTGKPYSGLNTNMLPKTAKDGQIIRIVYTNPKSEADKPVASEYQYSTENEAWSWSREYSDGYISSSGRFVFEGQSNDGNIGSINNTIEQIGVQSHKAHVTSEKLETFSKVVTGSSLASQMIEVTSDSSKKEVISEAKKANKAVVKHKMKLKVSGAWKKTAKTLSKVKNIAAYAGKALGIADVVINTVNTVKTLFDKKASGWKKAGAVLSLAGSVLGLFIKATPLGFALSLGISIFTSWWNK